MILTSVDKQQAFRYMGYQNENVPADITAITDKCEKTLLDVITPLYCFRVFDIDFTDNGVCLCGSSLVMQGSDIKRHLEGCSKAALLCVTLGTGADRLIRQLAVSDMTESVITDSLASAATEQLCDIAELEIRQKLPDKFMTWRFSPGYGDFPIIWQRELLNLIDATRRIGLYLSDGGMLVPSKSVTAVIGVSEKPVPKKQQGCITCNIKDRCSYRKRGIHCEF